MSMDLWTTASGDIEAEREQHRVARVAQAASSFWPFLAAARSVAEYRHRKALIAGKITSAVETVAEQGTGGFIRLHAALSSTLDSDFNALYTSPEREAERRRAASQAIGAQLMREAKVPETDVVQNNTSKAYNDAYEGGFQRGWKHKQEGTKPEFEWPRDGDRYMREPDVEGYLDAYQSAEKKAVRTVGRHRLAAQTSTCRHCDRPIVNDGGRWVDPEATGDDSLWRETCDAHDTFTAEHEPKTSSKTAAKPDYGEMAVCKHCDGDIQYVGKDPGPGKEFMKGKTGNGWFDRGGNYTGSDGHSHEPYRPVASKTATAETCDVCRHEGFKPTPALYRAKVHGITELYGKHQNLCQKHLEMYGSDPQKLAVTAPGFYRTVPHGKGKAGLEWVPPAELDTSFHDVFPDGVPLRGELTPAQDAELKRRSMLVVARGEEGHSGSGLTHAELNEMQAGEPLHFTNWPGRPSKPVSYVGPRGLVRFEDGKELHAFPDELSRAPRAGLEASLRFTADVVDDIMKWEDGSMSPDEEAKFFQGLIDSGMAWKLQGMYGRRATDLINAGVCHPAKTAGWKDVVKERIAPYPYANHDHAWNHPASSSDEIMDRIAPPPYVRSGAPNDHSECDHANGYCSQTHDNYFHSSLQSFAEYHYIRERDGKYEIWQKGTGKTLSTHDSKSDAEAAFRAMMQSKHGSLLETIAAISDDDIDEVLTGVASLQVEAVTWGRRHYEDLASLISQHPQRQLLARHFAQQLTGTNPLYRPSQFETAAGAENYRVRGGTGTAKYSRGHYTKIADAISSAPASVDKKALASTFADHFARTNGRFKKDTFMKAVGAKAECEYPSDNHSDDLMAVYHGDPSGKPIYLCGYHEQRIHNGSLPWPKKTKQAVQGSLTVKVIHPDGTSEVKTISGNLQSLQSLVGGMIEAVPLANGMGSMYINEEGKIHGLPPNPAATALCHLHPGDYIAGVAVLTGGIDDEGGDLSYVGSKIAVTGPTLRSSIEQAMKRYLHPDYHADGAAVLSRTHDDVLDHLADMYGYGIGESHPNATQKEHHDKIADAVAAHVYETAPFTEHAPPRAKTSALDADFMAWAADHGGISSSNLNDLLAEYGKKEGKDPSKIKQSSRTPALDRLLAFDNSIIGGKYQPQKGDQKGPTFDSKDDADDWVKKQGDTSGWTVEEINVGSDSKTSTLDKLLAFEAEEYKPTNTWPCQKCGTTVERYRGESDVSCPKCGAQYNAGGQRLRDDWRGNSSNYDDDIDDLEGFERQHAYDASLKASGRHLSAMALIAREEIKRLAGDSVEVRTKPKCDVHKAKGEDVDAEYDARLPAFRNTWGNVCQDCFDQYGPGQTGTGHAQKYVVKTAFGDFTPDPTMLQDPNPRPPEPHPHVAPSKGGGSWNLPGRAEAGEGAAAEGAAAEDLLPLALASCRKCVAGHSPDGSFCDYCDGMGSLTLMMAARKAAEGWEQGITRASFLIAAEDNREYIIQGDYGLGWETVNHESTREDAERSLKEYNDNETWAPHRLHVRTPGTMEAHLTRSADGPARPAGDSRHFHMIHPHKGGWGVYRIPRSQVGRAKARNKVLVSHHDSHEDAVKALNTLKGKTAAPIHMYHNDLENMRAAAGLCPSCGGEGGTHTPSCPQSTSTTAVDHSLYGPGFAAPAPATCPTCGENPHHPACPHKDASGYVVRDYNDPEQQAAQSHQGVNTSADGAARYQRTPSPAVPDWITQWDDPETRLTQRETDQGRASAPGSNPVPSQTDRPDRVPHFPYRPVAGLNPWVPDPNEIREFQGHLRFQANPYTSPNNPYMTDGPGQPDSGGDAGDSGPDMTPSDPTDSTMGDPVTSRPRVKPSTDYTDGNGDSFQSAPTDNGGMGGTPGWDSTSPATPPWRAAASLREVEAWYASPERQRVASKAAQVADTLQESNPGLAREQALGFAVQTIRGFPRMISGINPSAIGGVLDRYLMELSRA